MAADRRTEGRTPIASGEIVPGTLSSAAESGCRELVSAFCLVFLGVALWVAVTPTTVTPPLGMGVSTRSGVGM